MLEPEEDYALCSCPKCRGKSIPVRLLLKHIDAMLQGGAQCEAWMKKYLTPISSPEILKKREAMTNLGRFLTDENHPWKKPVHESSDVPLITYAAFMLDFCNKKGCSEAEIDSLLQMVYSVSVPNSNLPKTHKEICKITDELVIDHKEHFVCPCGYFTFVKEELCPGCKRPKTEAHRYYTIPIISRLKQMLEVPCLSELLAKKKGSFGPFMDDIHTTPAWHQFQQEMGTDPNSRTVALSYCSDGFNPYHHQATSRNYSIWAQSGIILNLPAEVRTHNPMLFGLISGPSTPANINAFNRVLVDELSILKEGVLAYDSSTDSLTILKGGVMMLVCDVPGAAKEQNRVQHCSMKACPHCNLEGEHSSILDKVVFLGSRKFLRNDDCLRHQTDFPSGREERETVRLRTNQEELAYSRCLDSFKIQELTGKVDKPLWSGFARDTGRHGSHQWFRLGLDLSQHHAPVEPMHAIKVIAEHITRLLNGTDDGPKVRSEERSRGRFLDCCPDAIFRTHSKSALSNCGEDGQTVPTIPTKRTRSSLPAAPFTLSKEEKERADGRLKSLKVPIDFGDMPTTLFIKSYGMKSHTWLKIYTSGVLRYILRDCLGTAQRGTLFSFLRCLEELYSRQLSRSALDRTEQAWHHSLALMERDFPCSIQGAVMHIMHHLPHYLRKFGPVSNFWMFPFERLNSTLSRAIGSARYPELAAIKHMKIQWMMSMLQAAGYLPPAKDQASDGPGNGAQLTGGKTSSRDMNTEEMDNTTQIYQQMNVSRGHSTRITVHQYARKFIPRQGSTVTYRAAPLELRTIQKSSVVAYAAPGGSCVGQLQHLFSHDNGEALYHFASVKWYGYAKQTNGKCFTVGEDTFPCPGPIVLLDRLSPPLVHAWEGRVLWLPSLV